RFAFWKQRAADHDPEVEALDPLGGPVGGQLTRADTPDLFRVGLEEDAEQPPAELVAHPVLQRLRIPDWRRAGTRVAGKAQQGLERAQVPERVESLDGIGEEPAPVVDARESAPAEHLL